MKKKPFVTMEKLQEITERFPTLFTFTMRGEFVKMPWH